MGKYGDKFRKTTEGMESKCSEDQDSKVGGLGGRLLLGKPSCPNMVSIR